MTTPTTKAPVKTAAPKTPAKAGSESTTSTAKAADIDFSKLSVSAAPAPKVSSGAGRKAEDNSVAEGWIKAAWAERKENEKIGGGRTVTVPSTAASTLVSKLRRAAKALGLGLAVQTTVSGDKTSVNFAPKVAKVYKKKEEKKEEKKDETK